MIELSSPASSANLGAGYDVFGLALEDPRDRMWFRRSNETRITVRGKHSERVPGELEKNSAGVVVKELMKRVNSEVEVVIEKNIRPCSGLGSSAASSAGAAVGINELFDLGLSEKELLRYSALGEEVAAGTRHLDNVAPLIYGGLCAVNPSSKEVIDLEAPGFKLVIVLPEEGVNTEEARKKIPKKVDLEGVKKNLFYATSLLKGTFRDDAKLFGRGLRDELVEPIRTQGSDFFELAKKIALQNDAFGLTLSGSGPALICTSKNPEKTRDALKKQLTEIDKDAKIFVTEASEGIRIRNKKNQTKYNITK